MKTTHLSLAKIAVLFFFGMGIVLSSCSGEDGKDGINGEMGPKGQDGNANVIVSDWMQITWDIVNYDVPPTSGRMYFQEIPGISDIDVFMETGGVVLFYLKHSVISNGILTYTTLLPYQEDTDHIYAYYATTTAPQIYAVGLILRAESNDVTQFENNDDYMIRYVLIPANVAEASDISNKIPENFDEAATLLGLEQ